MLDIPYSKMKASWNYKQPRSNWLLTEWSDYRQEKDLPVHTVMSVRVSNSI